MNSDKMVEDLVIPLGSAAVGGIIGATATLLSSFGLHKKRMDDREKRIRSALITEMESVEFDTDDGTTKNVLQNAVVYMKEEGRIPENTLGEKTVYENTTDQIALLNKPEMEKTVNYYSSLNLLNNMSESMSGIIDRGDIDDEVAQKFANQIFITDKYRREALEELRKNL